jgi:hypothetical protein
VPPTKTAAVIPSHEYTLGYLGHHRVEFLVIGGYAVRHYVPTRQPVPKDLDLWIHNTPENLEKLHRTFLSLGFSHETAQRAHIPRAGLEVLFPDGGWVEFHICSPSGLSHFEEPYRHRATGRYGNASFPVLALNDLIHNKRSTDRAKDRADRRLLETLQHERSQEQGLLRRLAKKLERFRSP